MVGFKIKRGLGRGLSSLIGDSKIETNINKLSISDLIRNKNQPRKLFDKDSLEGLTQLMKTIDRIKNNLNPDLFIRGILLTMYDKRNKLSGEVEKEARDYFKEKVYQTVVPRNVRLSEAPSHGIPVLIYDKTCSGSKSYFSFTDEFINQELTIGSVA